MRFLKAKILRAHEVLNKKLADDAEIQVKAEPMTEEASVMTQPSTPQSPSAQNAAVEIAEKLTKSRQKQVFGQKRKSQKRDPNGSSRATKNVVINFGKAIASFAISPLAVPYLKPILEKEGVSAKEFAGFVGEAKAGIGGIDSFRSLVLIENADTPQLAACKRVFAAIGTVFIKYFSVNWITHGRVTHKLVYLKYRGKVLRRIQNPELFTYISENKRR